MVKQLAVPVPLKVWQDPQGDVVLQHSRERCTISFACWEDAGEPADYICQLVFDHAWAVRAVNSEFLPSEIHEPQRSCIYEVKESEWLIALSKERSRCHPEWRNWDKRSYHHYVVQGHDNYCEVLAEGFVERIVSRDEAGVLARLIDES